MDPRPNQMNHDMRPTIQQSSFSSEMFQDIAQVDWRPWILLFDSTLYNLNSLGDNSSFHIDVTGFTLKDQVELWRLWEVLCGKVICW